MENFEEVTKISSMVLYNRELNMYATLFAEMSYINIFHISFVDILTLYKKKHYIKTSIMFHNISQRIRYDKKSMCCFSLP